MNIGDCPEASEEFGWVFFRNSEQFVDTGDYRWCLAGAGPLIVDAATGALRECDTMDPVEYHIEQYRRNRVK